MNVDIVKIDNDTDAVFFSYKIHPASSEYKVTLPFVKQDNFITFKLTEETLHDLVNIIKRTI